MNVWLISLIILVMLIQSYHSLLCPSRSVASASYVDYSDVVLVHIFVGWVISLYCVYIEDAVDSVIDLLIFLNILVLLILILKYYALYFGFVLQELSSPNGYMEGSSCSGCWLYSCAETIWIGICVSISMLCHVHAISNGIWSIYLLLKLSELA